jgi:L-threonylcarbamoyladenylate synthase
MASVGNSIEQATNWLREGYPVAIPTETVYGLAANACREDALIRIFEAKKRPLFDPLIVHLPTVNSILPYAKDIPRLAFDLWERYSPGPLTLVLPKSDLLPDLLSSGLPTAGFRIPDHPVALQVLNAIDFPLAAPSANLFGRVSPTTAAHVLDQLGDHVPYVLDGGPCSVGLESTIIDLSGPEPILRREGGIPSQSIEEELKITLQRPAHAFRIHDGFLPSAGTLDNHYAPKVPLICYHNIEELTNIASWLSSMHPDPNARTTGKPPTREPTVGMLRFQTDIPNHFRVLCDENKLGDLRNVEILSPRGDLQEAARNLFAAMRSLELGCDLILAEQAPEHGLGLAINDRLRRASVKGAPR